MPFTAETSPVELVASAEKTNHVVSPANCVVVECYFMLGLERCLRRYEHVRDVVNSWDNDEQNSLLILPCDSPGDDRGLDLASVPRTEEPPSGFCLQLHHSARPSKWNKRWVTLLDSGQVFASKRAGASSLDKDSVVLCHLSDFDIYSPKESEMRRNLKPPKKYCYAIKSQQKTTAFPNGENFVHFFCTDDGRLASRFYSLVHGWRSWYLANRLVDLVRREKPPQITHSPLLGVRSQRETTAKGGKRGPRVSIDETYRSEEPLMDVSGFKVPDVPRVDTTLTKSSKSSPRSKGLSSPSPWSEPNDKDSEFFAGGLLGDAYDRRKQEEAANAQARGCDAKADGPFAEGPSLLNGRATAEAAERSEPKSWFPSAAEHSARARSQSGHPAGRRPMTADAAAQLRREKQQQQQHHHHHPHHHHHQQQPLLSFGNEFPEPPRFRDAHGHGVRHASGQPLINFATGGPTPPHGASPQRAPPRRAVSGPGPGAPPPPPPPGIRSRSRSTVGPGAVGGGGRFSPEDLPPVPPLPSRPVVRRDRFGDGSPGGGPSARHAEPLVSRAR